MPKCSNCGEFSPDSSSRCDKCGRAFELQRLAHKDTNRGRVAQVFQVVMWITAAIVVLAVAPTAYHAAALGYYRSHLQSLTESVTKGCGGPIPESGQAFEKDQLKRCLDQSTALTAAQKQFDDFNQGSKPNPKK